MSDALRPICVFEEDEFSRHLCTSQEFIDHVNKLHSDEIQRETIPVDVLMWSVEPSVNGWVEDIVHHITRVVQADLSYPPVIYDNCVADGVHRIVKASMLGYESMDVVRIQSIPQLSLEFKEPYSNMVTYMEDVANIMEQE